MKTIIFLALLLFWSNAEFAQTIPNDRLYLGQTPPGNTPVIFAPGVISLTGRRETKIVFSPAGNECLIGIGESGTFKILYTKFENGIWPDARPSAFITNDRAQEPFFSPDGRKIFFTSQADIYMCARDGSTWSAPVKLGMPVNTAAEEYHPIVTLNGTLYFCSMRDNSKGEIYRSKYENGNYKTVEKLDTLLLCKYGAWDPFIAPDESYIIFTSIYPDGFG
jgi:Tol biopolymer transport system component